MNKVIEYFCYASALISAQVVLMPFGLHSWELAYGAFCGIAIRDIVDWFIEICDKCKGDNQ